MNYFKNNYLVIFAFLVIGLTVSSKVGFTKSKKALGATQPCLKSDPNAAAAIQYINTGNSYYNDPMVPPPPSPAFPDCPLDEIGCALLLTRMPQDVVCDLTPNFFCCAIALSDCATPLQKDIKIFCISSID